MNLIKVALPHCCCRTTLHCHHVVTTYLLTYLTIRSHRTYFPSTKYERKATLFCPAFDAPAPTRAIMSAFPAAPASNVRPPKSSAWCRHSCARPNSHRDVASSASCFHFCSDCAKSHRISLGARSLHSYCVINTSKY